VKKQENVSLDMRANRVDGSVMTMTDTIREKLTQIFAPVSLDVTDESALHAGHSGARPGGETHFAVRIVSNAFEGVGRVERQRRVYAALAQELKTSIHALSLTTLTPAEMWNEH
jgi:BolA family transcriptional regulator, general stress-responsive regulator